MNELWIPILGIIAVFGAPVFIVWLALRAHHQKRTLLHETINKLIEKDQPVPADMIKAFDTKKPMNHLQTGVILLSVGIGLGFFSNNFNNIVMNMTKKSKIDFILTGKEETLGCLLHKWVT